MATQVECDLKAPFPIATTARCFGEGATPFPRLLYFILDTYLILLSVKQGGIRYHFLNLWYDSTWDWSKISWTIGEYHHHHHVVLVAWIFLTLSRHISLSFFASVRSSGLHPVSSHSCWLYVRAGRLAFARPCVGVHKST